MRNGAIISILGGEAGDKPIVLITEGEYSKKNGKYFMSYKETPMTGFDEGTVTTVEVDGGRVIMTREGGNNAQMVFEKGQRHIGHYETPYGSFTVGIVSDKVNVDIGEHGGSIQIGYRLEIDNRLKARHDLNLDIREKN